MHHQTLEHFRRLLFLTVLEAAKNVARTPTCPDGVSERAWNRWEAGSSPIPQEVADNVIGLIVRRQQMIDAGQDATAHIDKSDIVAYRLAHSVKAQLEANQI